MLDQQGVDAWDFFFDLDVKRLVAVAAQEKPRVPRKQLEGVLYSIDFQPDPVVLRDQILNRALVEQTAASMIATRLQICSTS